jgi:hypothetical protein
MTITQRPAQASRNPPDAGQHSGVVPAAADTRDALTERQAARERTTPVAWLGHAKLTAAEWQACGRRLTIVANATNWWLGDWIRFGKRHYNDHHYQLAAHITGHDQQTLANYAYVAGRYETSRRRENLTWSHHAQLAALTIEDQDHWLDQAITLKLSVRQLRDAVCKKSARKTPRSLDGARVAPQITFTESAILVACHHCGGVTEFPLSDLPNDLPRLSYRR